MKTLLRIHRANVGQCSPTVKNSNKIRLDPQSGSEATHSEICTAPHIQLYTILDLLYIMVSKVAPAAITTVLLAKNPVRTNTQHRASLRLVAGWRPIDVVTQVR